ncbi:MAG TPA: zinc ribbon domain-containing protein [Anaerolineales bacterium]|nr:zinc ribbon domain-containing protein [Anaerolineales bacterium]HRF46171.1 zinc ribbon domain-containing protein [Anaerolineales bacterium]
MPFYDFFCADCQKRVAVFQSYKDYGVVSPVCPDCGGKHLKRKPSRVRIAKSDERRMEEMADPGALFGDVDENDPKSVARAMRKMGQQMGEELPQEFSEITDRLESGESPESIEQSLPDLGGGAGASDD